MATTGDHDRADVAIVGAGLSGLVAGAILTRHGRRVVVLEHADQVGGRGGATLTTGGYWVGFGHRDAHDVGDCQLPWHFGAEAAREAGVEVALRPVAAPLRLHRFPEDVVLDGAAWGADGLLGGAETWFECPRGDVPELRALVAKLASASDAERDAAIPTRLGDWLDRATSSPAVRRAVLRMATVIFHPRPEEASLGRFMHFLGSPGGGPYIPDDEAVGGMQGLMEPWARALRARGGEIALGWKPVEILVEGGRVRGAVAIDRSNAVREVRAPVAICTYPAWEVLDVLPRDLVPDELAATAEALRDHRADLIGWRAGLVRLPTVRATAEPDAHAGWNRLLRGPDRDYHGGFQITSLSSRRAAPPGRHLLELVIARFAAPGAPPASESWSAARARVDEAIAYLRRFYADLDDCLEWSSYVWVEAPQSMSWAWAPVRRHGLTVAGIDGLLLAGSTIESPARIVDLSAWAGLAAAHHVLGA
ncbi:MAG TPA: FAD-binding protein [Candidatus Binatia bacterium]|nr:FAD-binding protein [Candidatus Binatia bacterium]